MPNNVVTQLQKRISKKQSHIKKITIHFLVLTLILPQRVCLYQKMGKRRTMKTTKGFTLIELMIVVAIIGLLTMVAVPSFNRYLGKAKRAEAYMNLNSLYAAERSYWAEHGAYTNQLSHIGWKPQGYQGGGSQEAFNYTYGFGSSSEGIGCFTGKLGASIAGGQADRDGFLAMACADIDGDGQLDILSIDHNGVIRVVQDDL